LEEADVWNRNDEGMAKQPLNLSRLPLTDIIYAISELSMHKSRGQSVDTVRKSISFIQRPSTTTQVHKWTCAKEH